MFQTLETVKEINVDLDPKVERSVLGHRNLKSAVKCYRKFRGKEEKKTV